MGERKLERLRVVQRGLKRGVQDKSDIYIDEYVNMCTLYEYKRV